MSVKGKVDLHFHTECSGDAFMPLFSIIPTAERLGLRAVAKTDHDSVSGCSYLIEAAKNSPVEFIPAVELSTAEKCHIIGYYIDPENKDLIAHTNGEKDFGRRLLRKRLQVWKQNGGNLPDDTDALYDDVKSLRHPDAEITIKQICNFLVGLRLYNTPEEARADSNERVPSEKEIRDNSYKGIEMENLPTNVPPTIQRALEVIEGAGGVAVIPHPEVTRTEEILEILKRGAVGVGVLRNKEDRKEPGKWQYWLDYAKDHDIILTGGTDWHGDCETWNILSPTITPYRSVEQLKQAVKRIHGRDIDAK